MQKYVFMDCKCSPRKHARSPKLKHRFNAIPNKTPKKDFLLISVNDAGIIGQPQAKGKKKRTKELCPDLTNYPEIISKGSWTSTWNV